MNKQLAEIRARHYPDALGFQAAIKEAYLAGEVAGMERSMEACDREREIYQLGPPGSLRNDVIQMGRAACWGCAAAIRLLDKEQK